MHPLAPLSTMYLKLPGLLELLTHAVTVTCEGSRTGFFGMSTALALPSKLSAFQKRPRVGDAPPCSVPLSGANAVSCAVVPDASLKLHVPTGSTFAAAGPAPTSMTADASPAMTLPLPMSLFTSVVP